MFTKNQDLKVPKSININFTSFAQPNGNFYNPNFTSSSSLQQQSSQTQHKKGRPGGGWDSDDDQEQKSQNFANNTGNKKPESKGFSFISSKKENSNQIDNMEVIDVDESFIAKYEYENKIVHDSTQLGGARLKQSDLVLNEFCRIAENLNTAIVGSLLIYQLKIENPWISKARTLYNIEALIKKYPKYLEYFKTNDRILKGLDFTNEGPNFKQLKNIMDTIINFLNDPQIDKNKTQPIIQYQPQNDLIDFKAEQTYPSNQGGNANQLGNNNNEKLNAFNFVKKDNTKSNTPTTASNGSSANNFDNDLLSLGDNKPISQNQQQQPTINKPNAFGFISKSSNNNNNASNDNKNTNQGASAITQHQGTNTFTQNQSQNINNQSNKANAFNFIKSKPQTTTSQPTSNQTPLSQQTQEQKPKSDTNSLLNLNFTYNQEPRAGNILNMYSGSPLGTAYPPNAYPTDQNLTNINFTGPTNYPPQSYGYGYPAPIGYPPAYPPMNQYYGHYNVMQGNMNGNTEQAKSNNYNNPKDYDQLVKEIQNGVNYMAISEEQKKLSTAEKQKKEEQDKYFDFIKF